MRYKHAVYPLVAGNSSLLVWRAATVAIVAAGLFLGALLSPVAVSSAAAQSGPTLPSSGVETENGDAQEEMEEAEENASPEDEQNAEDMSPNDEGPISEANDESQDQMENPSPEKEENADRADPDRDEPGTQEEAQESGAEQSENATEEEEEAADSVDGDDSEGGFLEGIAVDMVKSIGGWIGDGIEEEAKKRTEDLSTQLTEGRYMLEPPNNALTDIYDDVGNWVKPVAIALFLLLGLSMTLRGTNYDTAYAAQTGIPKIVLVIAGIAFMPTIIGLIADLSREISNQVVDEQAMQQGFERLTKGDAIRKVSPVLTVIVWLIKGIFSVLLLFAVAVQNLIFGILFVIGPLAIVFHAIPRFEDVAAAWFRGILASFVISILWSLEFGFGYRLVGDPTILYEGTGWSFLPLFISLGILWLAWKTPWWVYQWAFHSYSASGGGGSNGARTAVSVLGLFKGISKGGK